jgi:peptidylprolyl isomerase
MILGTLVIIMSPVCHSEDWRALDPNNTLIINTSKGQLIVEMRPDMAPKSVERLKLLVREGTYNGLQFHRVIANFVAQTGNPNNNDNGRTAYPNLAPEFTFKLKRNSGEVLASNASDAASGFLGSVPFQSTPLSTHEDALRASGAFCPGVAGMGRDEALDSANSEFFFMLSASRRMDRDYTVFGRVVIGMDILLALKQGEPPADPDLMHSVWLLADLPAAERPKVSVMSGAALMALIEKVRREKAADFSLCDVVVPAKLE